VAPAAQGATHVGAERIAVRCEQSGLEPFHHIRQAHQPARDSVCSVCIRVSMQARVLVAVTSVSFDQAREVVLELRHAELIERHRHLRLPPAAAEAPAHSCRA